MSGENDWSISFNPGSDEDIDTRALLDALKPLAAEINKTGHRRYEIILDEDNQEYPIMGEAISRLIVQLSEILPSAFITGHIENDEIAEDTAATDDL